MCVSDWIETDIKEFRHQNCRTFGFLKQKVNNLFDKNRDISAEEIGSTY